MNDTELDEMLNQWDTPPLRAELREVMRAGFTAARPRKKAGSRWFSAFIPGAGKGLLAGVAVGAVACLLLISQAFPQSLTLFSSGYRAGATYFLEYEFVRYADNGSPTVDVQITSLRNGGNELIVAMHSHPPKAQDTLVGIGGAFTLLLYRFAPSLAFHRASTDQAAWVKEKVAMGCAKEGVIGHETILGHATAVVLSSSPEGRGTSWLAPDMECYPLKLTNEIQRPDGTFYVSLRKLPITVVMPQSPH